jgi:hypothetical protein
MKPINRTIWNLLRAGVRVIDSILRVFYRIETFSEDPACLLRISLGRSQGDITLSDDWEVKKDDPVLDVHLWNERLVIMLAEASGIGVATRLLKDFEVSMKLLAAHLCRDRSPNPDLPLRAEFGFVTDIRPAKFILNRLGFDVLLKESPGLRFWRRAFWDNFYSFGLALAFNPDHMRGKRLADLLRIQVWMSPKRLEQRYLRPNC